MIALLRPFVQLCTFWIGPQNLPASTLLLGIALLAYTLTSSLEFVYLNGFPGAVAVAAGVTATAVLSALTAGLLYSCRLRLRIIQTLTALAGAIALIDTLELGIVAFYPQDAGDGKAPLMLSVTEIWAVLIQGNILRHALATPFIVGVVISIGFILLTLIVMRPLFLPAV